jgi:hypothetical protein
MMHVPLLNIRQQNKLSNMRPVADHVAIECIKMACTKIVAQPTMHNHISQTTNYVAMANMLPWQATCRTAIVPNKPILPQKIQGIIQLPPQIKSPESMNANKKLRQRTPRDCN